MGISNKSDFIFLNILLVTERKTTHGEAVCLGSGKKKLSISSIFGFYLSFGHHL
jgi:hypothetical protein